MQAEQYKAIAAWFSARPAAKKAFYWLCRASVAVVYLLYAGLLAWLAVGHRAQFFGVLCVPAAVFLAGTALRAAINRPRPYEALGFTPLFPKATVGQSMPSRHCFSAAAIAVAAFTVWLPLGVLAAALALCIAVSRVLSGVHYPSDVLAGLLGGGGAAALGFFVLAHFGVF